MRPAQYFDRRTGRELSASEALYNGMLKDGVSLRVHMSARDSARLPFDGSGNRPGWRIADTDFGRAARDGAYRDHELYLNRAYKMRDERDSPACAGTGVDADGVACERCDGSGEVDGNGNDNGDNGKRRPQGQREANASSDRRMLDARAASAAHQRNMTRLYDQVANELSQQWRRGK